MSSSRPQRDRPVIVHVIDSLVRGGAETLLVNLLPALAEHYDIVLVTLRPERDFAAEDVVAREYHCLGYTGPASLAACALRLRRIIRRHQPDLVRAQLYLSSVVARLATPREIPLVFSIHNPMSADSYRKNRLALPLEKLTYRKRHALISVSEDARRDFDRWVGVKGRSYVLHNFINPAYLEASRVRDSVGRPIRMVAVGMLKAQKNYSYLIEAFRKLKGREISLDIYGEGPLRAKLQADIDRHGLPITLKGKRGDIYKVLPEYDLYVMSSAYEGFGIAPVEAMAVGLPALLSDLPVLREVSGGNALFFDPADPADLVGIVERILAGEVDLKALSEGGISRARCYQKSGYVENLRAIYAELIDA